jgi:uncharacterized protein YndB with AHSA1/START domain
MAPNEMPPGPPTRQATYEIPIAAQVADVWHALTDAEELERWFALTADVAPGPSGRYVLRWRDRHAGDDWPILAWEPPLHLALGMAKPAGAPGAAHVINDFVLEDAGDRTVLRVVASGFDAGASWDGFFDGVRRGWRFELRSLKHYLERHRGEPRAVAWAWAPISQPLDAAWRTILAPDGWAPTRPLDQLRPGERYAIAAPDETVLSGTVTVVDRPTDFAGTVDEFKDGLLRVQLEPKRSGASATVWLAAYGIDAGQMAALETRWQTMLERLVNVGSAGQRERQATASLR